jgi:hypothetical protein
MPFELHVKKDILQQIVTRRLQERLRMLCIAPDNSGARYIDHIDVATSTGMRVEFGPDYVHYTVALDVFLVTLSEIDPGTTIGTKVPPGALAPLPLVERPTVVIALILVGAELVLTCGTPSIPVSATEIRPFLAPMRDAFARPSEYLDRWNLGPLLAGELKIPNPGWSFERIVDLGDTVVVTSTDGSPSRRLAAWEEWGMLLSCEEHTSIVTNMLQLIRAAAQAAEMPDAAVSSVSCQSGASLSATIGGRQQWSVPGRGVPRRRRKRSWTPCASRTPGPSTTTPL